MVYCSHAFFSFVLFYTNTCANVFFLWTNVNFAFMFGLLNHHNRFQTIADVSCISFVPPSPPCKIEYVVEKRVLCVGRTKSTSRAKIWYHGCVSYEFSISNGFMITSCMTVYIFRRPVSIPTSSRVRVCTCTHGKDITLQLSELLFSGK